MNDSRIELDGLTVILWNLKKFFVGSNRETFWSVGWIKNEVVGNEDVMVLSQLNNFLKPSKLMPLFVTLYHWERFDEGFSSLWI